MRFIEALMSCDANSGRVWTDSIVLYRKRGNECEWSPRRAECEWSVYRPALTAIDKDVEWSEDAGTLTPREALQALAAGKVLRDRDVTVWVGFDGTFRGPNGSGDEGPVTIHRLGGFRVVEDK